ncbi:GNAT family N-acetyltransferase (plasmid) [Rhizobium sp. CB3171]|uniref:GNAT family N-acetyltransferase n=1 Tax=Rhizobium sp. CB3171 TaxID=3039157 RepID=UPI0024B0C481|nr:GNAT family N-acetyltransferase [Rhizobium sp. CB3171]WFU04539.1 GNAT family N-acetyltransferase [Rhizobium sp. CB3171]
MTEQLIIQKATDQDLPDLIRLYAQLHPDGPEMSLENSSRILREFSCYSGSAIFIAKLGAALASTCTLVVVPNLTRGGTPYALIENVITDVEYRCRGFGRQVLEHAIEAAWRHNCYKVMLLTGSKETATLRFYTNVGFEQSKVGFQIRRVPARQS